MAQVRQQYTPENWNWIDHSTSFSVNSQTVIKLAGDLTGDFLRGRRVRLSGGSTSVYRTIESTSYTVETTITLRSGASLSASHSTVALSAVDVGGAVYYAATIADLQALTEDIYNGPRVHVTSYYATASYADGIAKGGGFLLYKGSASATATPSDGAVNFVDASGRWWQREGYQRATASQCGCYVDASTNDITNLNRALKMINEAKIEDLTLDPGSIAIESEPNLVTRGNFTIRGLGWDVSSIRIKSSAASSVGQVFKLGDVSNTVARASLLDFSLYADNTPDGTDAAIWFNHCITMDVQGIHISGFPQVFRYGNNSADEIGERVLVNNCHGNCTLVDGTHMFQFNSASGCSMTNSFWSGQNTGVPTSRIVSLAAVSGGAGIDGNLFSNCVFNCNQSDMAYGVVFDATNPGLANTRFTNCTIDGGTTASILFNISASASANGNSPNSRIYNCAISDSRVSASTSNESASASSDGGGAVHITQTANRYINGIEITNNVFSVGSKQAAVLHTRDSAVSRDSTGFIFDGNVFSNAYQNADLAGTTRPVFSIAGNGFVITNNKVGAVNLATDTQTGGNFFTYFVDLTEAQAWNNVIANNEVSRISAVYPVNVSALSGAGIELGPVITGNSGKPQGPYRKLRTTDSSSTIFARTNELTPGTEYVLKATIIGKKANTTRAWYEVEALARASATGSASVWASTVTTKHETSAGFACAVNSVSGFLRILVTGSATCSWTLPDYRILVGD